MGLCAGILSGLVGVGGGSVIVPGMELAVGAGDLIARGTSLLVMIPTGIAGTVTNLRHGMVDLRIGLIVGASAAAIAPVGRLAATLVSPGMGAILFNIFMLSIIASTILKMRKKARAQGNYVRLCWGTVLMASLRHNRHRPRSDANGPGLVETRPGPNTKPLARRADHSSAALGCVMSAGTTHASNSSAVRKPSSRADSRSDRPL